jgi:type I restriction enzyme M protein
LLGIAVAVELFCADFNDTYNSVLTLLITYSDIFDSDEFIEIEGNALSFIVSKLEDYSLLNAERDIIADAFEELIGKMFRGGEGQFFTPRNIVQMMIDILQPQEGEKIIDPACGSGGFLAHIVKYFVRTNKIQHNVYGIDKDLFLSRLAKIYLTILGENEYHIYCENSLECPKIWRQETQDKIKLNSFDLTQATLSTLGDRLLELVLPLHKDSNQIQQITNEIQNIITTKALLRKRTQTLLEDTI